MNIDCAEAKRLVQAVIDGSAREADVKRLAHETREIIAELERTRNGLCVEQDMKQDMQRKGGDIMVSPSTLGATSVPTSLEQPLDNLNAILAEVDRRCPVGQLPTNAKTEPFYWAGAYDEMSSADHEARPNVFDECKREARLLLGFIQSRSLMADDATITEAERITMKNEHDQALARLRAWEIATGETQSRIVKGKLEQIAALPVEEDIAEVRKEAERLSKQAYDDDDGTDKAWVWRGGFVSGFMARVRRERQPPAKDINIKPAVVTNDDDLAHGWCVLIMREGLQMPSTFGTFEEEVEARQAFSSWSAQWSESYLCKIVEGPRKHGVLGVDRILDMSSATWATPLVVGPHASLSPKTFRALVVAGYEVVIDIIINRLHEAGISDIMTASSLEGAKNAWVVSPYDIVVIDNNIPRERGKYERIAIELAEWILSRSPTVPIAVWAGNEAKLLDNDAKILGIKLIEKDLVGSSETIAVWAKDMLFIKVASLSEPECECPAKLPSNDRCGDGWIRCNAGLRAQARRREAQAQPKTP